MSPKTLCERILRLNSHITFVGVINNLGELRAEAHKGASILKGKTEQDTGYLLQGIAAFRITRSAQDKTLGATEFVCVKRKKSSQFSIPYGDDTIFVAMKPSAPLPTVQEVVLKVRSLANSS